MSSYSCKLKFLCVTTLLLVTGLSVSAQMRGHQWREQRNGVRGVVKAHEADSTVTVPGAVILLGYKGDTLKTTTDAKGAFHFNTLNRPGATIIVLHLSYEKATVQADFWRPMEILLKENKEVLASAVVQGSKPVIEQIGDTLKYNVAATQQIRDDDMLVDVLEQLPGVEVENGAVTVQGKELSRIYINGKLVFGDGMNAAMQNLSAQEVATFKVYDQKTLEERRTGIKSTDTERVMNVQTKHKLDFAWTMQTVASYGRNMRTVGDETDNRYGGGVNGNFFSEKSSIRASVQGNNTGQDNPFGHRTSIERLAENYRLYGTGSVGYTRKFGDAELGTLFSADYRYNGRKGFDKGLTDREYTPGKGYTSRTYHRSSDSDSRSGGHTINLQYRSRMKSWVPSMSLSLSTNGSENNSSSRTRNLTDSILTGNSQRNHNESNNFRVSGNVGEFKKIADSLWMGVNGSFNIGSDTGSGCQLDSLIGGPGLERTILDPMGKSRSVSGLLSLNYQLRGHQLGLSYSINNAYSKSRQYRYRDAIAEANLDSLTSNDNTYNYTNSNINLTFTSKERRLFVNAGIRNAVQNKSRELPEPRYIPREYWSFTGRIFYKLSANSLVNNSTISLQMDSRQPSIEQTDSHFDNRNPLSVTRGNPDLNQSRTMNLNFHGEYILGESQSVGIDAGGGYVFDNIVNRSIFYPDGGEVDGFRIRKGATFNTYENIQGNWNASARIRFGTAINFIKYNLTTSLNYDFNRNPQYIDNVLNIARRHSPRFNIHLNSNFSRDFRLNFSYNTSLSYVNNDTYKDVSYANQGIRVSSSNDITRWLFINAVYNWYARVPLKNASGRIESQMLNALVGVRFLKGRRGELSLGCYDILNKTPVWTTSVSQNYTQTTYSPNFGRIWNLIFTYRFNSTRNGGTRGRGGRPGFGGPQFPPGGFRG